jgi:hypothetical protein
VDNADMWLAGATIHKDRELSVHDVEKR